ncbi:MAG: hypothetical protein DRJ42_04430 [Deltaproteobacteria bacterium]|nr:MAG: hypothetical protein DRJ42_04430 [Deltaproteobacteria bacterium]
MKYAQPTILSALLILASASSACETSEYSGGDGGDKSAADRLQDYADGVESNVPFEAASKLALALQQDRAEAEGGWTDTDGISDDSIRDIFAEDADLNAAFSSLSSGDRRLAYRGMREILHNLAAMRIFQDGIAAGDYLNVYADYVDMRPALLDRLGETEDGSPPAGALPTLVLNIPSERSVVFHDGVRYHDDRSVVGLPVCTDDPSANCKTRVGDHEIASWHHCYSNSSYPSWCDDSYNGAFGEFTAKLDRGYSYWHGTVGDGILDWFAIRTAPGSHGCIRNTNSSIGRLHDILPVGTSVRKTYSITERTMNVVYEPDGETWDYPFDQTYAVTFDRDGVDNLYGYDTGSAPNGTYYPETGVVVGYEHPTDALTTPF